MHPVYVAQNQTLNAICSASGFLNSAVGTQAYSAIVLPKTSFSTSAIAASENTVPFPNPNRSIAVEWSNVLVTPASDCNTYNWSGLDAWATQSAAKGVTNLHTFSHVPGCANAGGTQDVPPTDVNSGDTFYKNFQTAFWNHICSVSSPPVSPLPSSSCKNFKYVEEWNEFNTDLYRSGSIHRWRSCGLMRSEHSGYTAQTALRLLVPLQPAARGFIQTANQVPTTLPWKTFSPTFR